MSQAITKATSIASDAVHLAFYLPPDASGSLATATALASRLTAHAQALLPKDWIWHRDTLELKTSRRKTKSVRGVDEKGEWFLQGVMRVGDSIEDEWVALWLMRELTGAFEGVIGSIYDADGDFLLIEAAQVLPPWVTPDNSENRVWIANAHLHVIPLDVSSPVSTRPPLHERRAINNDDMDDETELAPGAWVSVEKALAEIRAGRWRNQEVEGVVWSRIASYPTALQEHQQRTTLYLPIKIAQALHREPSLIQKAVETFYTREPTQLRRAAKMTRFPPAASVLSQITMTRVAYAQLDGQEFWPSKAFGPEWTEPMSSDSAGQEKARRERGVKVAVGFEILCGESKARAKEFPGLGEGEEQATARISALKLDDEFIRYLETLKKAGWFPKGEIDGSKRWKEREDEAARGWIKICKTNDDDRSSRPTFSTLFEAALARPGPSTAAELAPPADCPDDSDDWLQVDPVQLEDLMKERSTGGSNATPASANAEGSMDVDEETQGVQELDAIAKRVGGFVEGKGEVEGAIFDDEMLSDDDGEDENDDEMDRDLMPSDDDDSADDDGHPLPSVSALSPAEIEARKAALVAPFDVSDWGHKSQLSAQSASTQAPAEEKEARPSSSSSATTPASQSASASALPISSETRKLEELDRRQRIKDLKDEEAKNLPPIKMRRPLLPRDQFDGVDSDDDSDGEGNGAADHGEDARSIKAAMKREGMDIDDGKGKDDGENDEDDDDKDQSHVVRDFEVDMAQEEEDFLKFAREALGVDEGMWESILSERAGRGSFVPSSSKGKGKATVPLLPTSGLKSASLSSQSPADKVKTSKSVNFGEQKAAEGTPMPIPKDPVVPGPRETRQRAGQLQTGTPDPSLDSFEAVMRAMDAELEKRKAANSSADKPAPSAASGPPLKQPSSAGQKLAQPQRVPSTPDHLTTATPSSSDKPPKSTSVVEEEDEDDPLAMMDAELRAALLAAGDVSDDEEGVDGLDEDQALDYGVIKNFLKSFEAQGGMAGPAGNLLGRLGKNSGK